MAIRLMSRDNVQARGMKWCRQWIKLLTGFWRIYLPCHQRKNAFAHMSWAMKSQVTFRMLLLHVKHIVANYLFIKFGSKQQALPKYLKQTHAARIRILGHICAWTWHKTTTRRSAIHWTGASCISGICWLGVLAYRHTAHIVLEDKTAS